MDAFSLAISLGINNLSKRKRILVSFFIGIFHFIMPLIGNKIGLILRTKLLFKTNLLVSIIFLLLGIEMYWDRNKEESTMNLSLISIFIITFLVSIDSLTVGIAYGLKKENIILASTIFMIVSTIFTYLGLQLGKKLQDKFQKKSTYLGIIILLLMSIKYLVSNS